MAAREEVRRTAAGRYWREAEARVVVDAWRRSGEPLARFARRQGVARQRLQRWARRLEEPGGSVRFHRVRLVEGRPVRADVRGAGAPIEIEWAGGQRVRVLPGFAAEDLRRVLETLGVGPTC